MPAILKNMSASTPSIAPSAPSSDGDFLAKNYDGALIAWDNRTVRSDAVSFGQAIYRPGGYCGPRTQRDYELVVLHSGEATVTVDGERRPLDIGTVALFLPGHREHYRFSNTHETHHSWCSVSRSLMPRPLARELLQAPSSLPCSEFFHRLLSSAFILGCPWNADSNPVIDRLGILLCTEYLHLSQASRNRNRRTEPVNKALSHIENHFPEDACLAGACHAAGISRNALIQHFTHELRTTPGRYVWKLRTEKGISMLAETGLTVAEIAYQCGFKTPFHFSRLVKQHQGISPREVRKQAWAEWKLSGIRSEKA